MAEELFTEGEDYPSVSVDFDEVIDDRAVIAARNAFGIKYLFPWQRLVVSNILDCYENFKILDEGKGFCEEEDFLFRGNQIVILPTGAGKSLCFLTPALLMDGPTLVIYPLLALMADQKRRMDEAGIPSVLLRGGLQDFELEEIFLSLNSGKIKVIVVNPEILMNRKILDNLKSCGICHIAIDEAHCACEWGDSFRPAYLSLGETVKYLGVKIVTAFTATASPPVLQRVSQIIFDGNARILQSSGDRPNIHNAVKYCYGKKKALLHCCKEYRKPLIVFCSTRRGCEDAARLLCSYFGREKVKFYHAGLTKEEKDKTEKWFFQSDDGILTATCAYGMGMDKGNIYTVIHLDPPEHLENFVQEAGRAGRKGDNVNSVLLWSHSDSVKFNGAKEGSRERVMKDYAESSLCRRQFILNYLSGEECSCFGCDVCDAQKQGIQLNKKALDAELALKLLGKNRRLYTKKEFAPVLTEKLNERDLEFFGENVWDVKDAQQIINQLLGKRKIKRLGGLWKNTLDIEKKERPYKKRIFPIRCLHRLHLFRRNFRRCRRIFLEFAGKAS